MKLFKKDASQPKTLKDLDYQFCCLALAKRILEPGPIRKDFQGIMLMSNGSEFQLAYCPFCGKSTKQGA